MHRPRASPPLPRYSPAEHPDEPLLADRAEHDDRATQHIASVLSRAAATQRPGDDRTGRSDRPANAAPHRTVLDSCRTAPDSDRRSHRPDRRACARDRRPGVRAPRHPCATRVRDASVPWPSRAPPPAAPPASWADPSTAAASSCASPGVPVPPVASDDPRAAQTGSRAQR